MTKEQIYKIINENRPPDLFGGSIEKLMQKYDLYLSLIDPKTPDEIGYMMDAMREIYEDKLKTISEQSLQDWQDGEIDDINKLPLVMKVVNGRREVQNIPHVIADWIGLIAYTRKKYSV